MNENIGRTPEWRETAFAGVSPADAGPCLVLPSELPHAELCGDLEPIGGAKCRLDAGHEGPHWGAAPAYQWMQ